MAAVAATYMLTSFCLARTLTHLPLKVVLLVGLVFSVTAFFLMGPCRWLPHVLPVVIMGVVCVSIGVAIGYIIAMPNLVEVATEELHIPCDDTLTDSLGSVATTFISLGEVTGPLLAGFLISELGFELAGTVMGCAGIAVMAMYLLSQK